MFWESSSAKSRRFPWINLAFYRGGGCLCKKQVWCIARMALRDIVETAKT
jgi:hypothetical protein